MWPGSILRWERKIVGVKASDWNKQLSDFPKPAEEVDQDKEVPTGLEGCLKMGAVIECPDGKYFKDGLTIDTIQKKRFDTARPKPKKRRLKKKQDSTRGQSL